LTGLLSGLEDRQVDGLSGVDLSKEHRDSVDLVILDMTMPGIGGHETFVLLRKINSQLPVIVSSGYALQDRSIFVDDPRVELLPKPINIQSLKAAMARNLQLR